MGWRRLRAHASSASERLRTRALPKTPGDDRAGIRTNQVQPPDRSLPTPRTSGREVGMATNHRHPQPLEASQAPTRRGGGLKRPPNDTDSPTWPTTTTPAGATDGATAPPTPSRQRSTHFAKQPPTTASASAVASETAELDEKQASGSARARRSLFVPSSSAGGALGVYALPICFSDHRAYPSQASAR